MNTNNGWLDIASAPKDGSRFIALGPIPVHGSVEVRETYWSFFGEGSIAKAMFERGEGPSGNWSWEEPMNNWVSSWRPTHWMPLPAAPGSPAETPAYTVTVDPDPRGVSVGVYQGSSCVYHGAHPIPAGSGPERDWEISCDACNGAGHVFVERQVAERKTDVQEFKEECEGCDGRGFTIAFDDIPGIAEYVKSCRPAPAAGDALDDQTRWTLRWIMREADAAKETCSTDPESPAAIRNAKLAAIATAAAQALGLVRGPSYADAGSGDAQDAARWRWIFSHAENVGFDYQSGRFTTLTIAGRQRESLVAFVDAAISASQQGGE